MGLLLQANEKFLSDGGKINHLLEITGSTDVVIVVALLEHAVDLVDVVHDLANTVLLPHCVILTQCCLIERFFFL